MGDVGHRDDPPGFDAIIFDGRNGPDVLAWLGKGGRPIRAHSEGMMLEVSGGKVLVRPGDCLMRVDDDKYIIILAGTTSSQ